MVEEMDAEGSGAVVRAAEESLSAGRVCSPAGPDTPAPTPRGSVLHQRLFLSPVQEGGRYQICRGFLHEIYLTYYYHLFIIIYSNLSKKM